MKSILILGSSSFLAKNLISNLDKTKNKILLINKKNISKTKDYIKKSSIIFFFIGKNRSNNKHAFVKANHLLPKKISEILSNIKSKKKIIFISTNKINEKNIYGITKKKGEEEIIKLKNNKKTDVKILRLPNIFGKSSKPNYNSVIATFCYKIARNQKIQIKNNKIIKCIYIDDLVNLFLNYIDLPFKAGVKIISKFDSVRNIRVAELASIIKKFKKNNFEFFNCKSDFEKNLYSTYLYFRPIKKSSSKIIFNKDKRGNFSELLKSLSYGQLSYFDINYKQTRGEHYHNTKWEKFFLVKGKCEYITRDLYSKKAHKFILDENNINIIDSIPGHVHQIKNINSKSSIFFVWASENFDIKRKDTFYEKI